MVKCKVLDLTWYYNIHLSLLKLPIIGTNPNFCYERLKHSHKFERLYRKDSHGEQTLIFAIVGTAKMTQSYEGCN